MNDFGGPRCSRAVGIRGIGTAVGPVRLTNAELADRLDTSDEWIQSHLGIRERRVAAAGQLTSDLGIEAIRSALLATRLDLRDIGLLIAGTWTPDYPNPPLATVLMDKLTPAPTFGFDVHCGGCSGGVFALDVAARYVATGAVEHALVVLADVNTRWLDPNDRRTQVIFGDGAGCYVLSACRPDRGIGSPVLRTFAAGFEAAFVPAGGGREPIDADAIAKGRQFFHMDGPAVKAFALERVPPALLAACAAAGLTPAAIDLVVLHQANYHLVHEIAARSGFAPDQLETTVQMLGNTASASIPLTLAQAAEQGRLRDGMNVLLGAFGAGLNVGAVVVRWCGPDGFVAMPAQREEHTGDVLPGEDATSESPEQHAGMNEPTRLRECSTGRCARGRRAGGLGER